MTEHGFWSELAKRVETMGAHKLIDFIRGETEKLSAKKALRCPFCGAQPTVTGVYVVHPTPDCPMGNDARILLDQWNKRNAPRPITGEDVIGVLEEWRGWRNGEATEAVRVAHVLDYLAARGVIVAPPAGISTAIVTLREETNQERT